MSGSRCQTLYPFSGERHRQGLRFAAGEQLTLLQVPDGGWWEGQKEDGLRGWFPASYVQLLEQKPRKVTPQPGEDSLNCPLPPGWQSYMSPQGHRYYVNAFTNANGYHTPVTPMHQMEPGHMSLRKPSGDPQINCVTFPHPDTMQEQQLLKPTEWSYCDYFWPSLSTYTSATSLATSSCTASPGSGLSSWRKLSSKSCSSCFLITAVFTIYADKKDPQGNNTVSGFEILLQKQLKGKQMQKEMAEFVRERIKIEEEYAKNLSKLSQNSLAAQEEGTLGEAWAQLKKSLADEAEVHLKFSSKLQSEVEKPLLNFRENFKKDMKKYDHHIADLRKQLASRYTAVEKARKALTERQKDLEMKTQQLEIKLSNKTEEEIKKARRKSTQAGDDLMRCVDLYNQAQSKWFEEMVTSTLELERLEVERVEMIRQHLCQYTQLRHETDMFNQSTIEPVDQLLQKVEPAKDRELWVQEHKTGDIRPVDMEI
ncbi:growth arrest-specific protein 7 isoform X6 [Natator depressus]|uniref:growth arrest-specific protein 7 isoform X6 n=1 Tax=Natator depressus TaxID=27790 RepID=UPI003EB8CB4D